MQVVFRVDAGVNAGLGHLMRCLSLARALERLGATCLFLSDGQAAARVTSAGFEFTSLQSDDVGGEQDLEQVITLARARQAKIVVVDSYHVDAAYLSQLRRAGFFVIAIDDLAAFPFPCQIVVNGSIYANEKQYHSNTGDTLFLLGPRYIFLREEFWNLPPRVIRERVENILLLLGGNDPRNLMPRLIAGLDALPGDFTITAVVGPFFENDVEIERAARGCQHRVELVIDPPTTRDVILAADLAISAGGQTLYELLAAGCPTIAIPIADNQIPNVRAWAERGSVLTVVVDDVELWLNGLRECVSSLMDSRDRRLALRLAGQKWIDVFGAERAAKATISAHQPGSYRCV